MRDYMVTGEMNTNMLVSPDYLKTGGTILDMFTENPLSLSDTQGGGFIRRHTRRKHRPLTHGRHRYSRRMICYGSCCDRCRVTCDDSHSTVLKKDCRTIPQA